MLRTIALETRGAVFALGLLLTCLIALGHLDWQDPLIMILGNIRVHITALLVFIALALMVAGARIRGVLLLGGAVFVLALVYRDLAPSSRLMATAEPDLKIIAFNMLGSNTENGPSIADYLLQSHADLVLLNESGPVVPFLEALAARYPFQLGCGGEGEGKCGDVLMLSRLDLKEPRITRLTGASGHQTVIARVEIDGAPLNVIATQLLRPYFGEQQIGEFNALRRLLDGLEGKTLVAGDFNAAAWFGPFSDLLDATGIKRAAFEPGTWPVELGDLGASIDHVLVSGNAAFTAISAMPDHFGSNHRGLVAEIALTPERQ
ncbi:endonuclease/exonuclease/phosphatase family protein [Devosia sp. BSSL-BM10]|uniref:Endonuclease/exonuclease/phosphatase family protein n=1 Tax=Devosia litorisediminis TaxID=2829817 RepID=A0A942EAX4_9HYPH|nr:endonuclease/exonuclease/phosphatase family protein [Devosia litorisediminis]MBS3848550.1 endonuclease/exonuclease/phosphatase family protein [Devosia litorisediminis]